MLKIIPCAPWNFPFFRFLTGKGRGVFHDFNGVFNISTVDNRYTRWITCGEYTECERYVNRKVACLCKRVEPFRPRRLGSSPVRGAFLRGHKLKIPLDISQTCAILVKYANEQLDCEQLEI